ncbi:MAG: DUF1638 domain-containing protein [Deltaproteobacteria bacterium]|nr:DUF1638 domain-containing protein [Deltaproteobacteria bacterium]
MASGREPGGTRVLACRVFQPELTSLGVSDEQALYLDQGLHRYPDQLRLELGKALAELEADSSVDRVILGYGFCGGGMQGVKSSRVSLVLPLVHDCVPLLLGNAKANPCVGCGGIFYLTPGWIDHGQTPYSEYFVTKKRFGHEDALWVGRQMLSGYHQVTLVDTGVGLLPRHRRYAREMARLFGLDYQQQRGHRDWLRRLLAGQPGPGLALIPPGDTVDISLYPQARSQPEKSQSNV